MRSISSYLRRLKYSSFKRTLSLGQQVAALFSAGEQGAWYDPSDFSTMFQDSTGIIPVTAVGQPVGKILDKSGRGNHAYQATATSRPVLQIDGNGKYYLAFDGVDDSLATAAIDFTATDKMTVWAGAYAPSASIGMFLEISTNAPSSTGAFYITDNESVSGLGTYRLRGTLSSGGKLLSPPPDLAVYSYAFDMGNDLISAKVNGASASGDMSAGADAGTGNFGNYALNICARSGGVIPFNGRLYSLIVRGAASTAAQITSGEQYAASKSGVTI